jgi:hypothetical protein
VSDQSTQTEETQYVPPLGSQKLTCWPSRARGRQDLLPAVQAFLGETKEYRWKVKMLIENVEEVFGDDDDNDDETA